MLLGVGDPATPSCARVFEAEVGELGVLRVAIEEVAPRRVEVEIDGEIDGRQVKRAIVARTCATAIVAADVVVGTVRAAVGRSERGRAVVEPVVLVPPPPVEPTTTTTTTTTTTATTPTLAPARPSAPAPLRTRSRGRTRELLVSVAAEGGISFGVLPRLAGDVGVRVGVGTRRWRGDVAASYLPLQRLSVDGGAAIVQAWSAELRALFVPRVSIVEFPVHLGVALGDVVAQGVDVTNGSTEHAFWGAALLGAGLTVVPTRRIGVGLDVSGTAAFSRPTFTFGRPNGSVQVHRPDLFGVRALLRVEIRLP